MDRKSRPAGHKRDLGPPDSPGQIDFMIQYLLDFDEVARQAGTAEEAAQSMQERYPELTLPILMMMGAREAVGEALSA